MAGAKRWAGLEAQAVLALRLAVGYGLNEKTLATRYTKRRCLRAKQETGEAGGGI